MSKKIIVTGATGNVASLLLPQLISSGAKVRALVRDPKKASALAEKGIEVVQGDLELPRSIKGAFDGMDTAMIIVPPGPRAPQQTSSAIWEARQGGVKHIVRLSAFGAAHNAPTVNSRLHALSDAELERGGIPYTILKPHFFMQNLFMAAQSIAKEGNLYFALGEGKMGMIDSVDIAAVAARVLTTAGHENKTYTMTGPRSISMVEVAEAFSKALQKPIKYIPIPLEASDQAMAQMGLDEFMRTMLGDYFAAYSNNWGNVVTEEVPRLLGRPARSIDDFAKAISPTLTGGAQ